MSMQLLLHNNDSNLIHKYPHRMGGISANDAENLSGSRASASQSSVCEFSAETTDISLQTSDTRTVIKSYESDAHRATSHQTTFRTHRSKNRAGRFSERAANSD